MKKIIPVLLIVIFLACSCMNDKEMLKPYEMAVYKLRNDYKSIYKGSSISKVYKSGSELYIVESDKLVCIDKNDKILWNINKNYNNSSSIIVDNSGCIYYLTNGELCIYDNSGTAIWSKNNLVGYVINDVDNEGNVYLVKNTDAEKDTDSLQAELIIYDKLGKIKLQKKFQDVIITLQITAKGNLLICRSYRKGYMNTRKTDYCIMKVSGEEICEIQKFNYIINDCGYIIRNNVIEVHDINTNNKLNVVNVSGNIKKLFYSDGQFFITIEGKGLFMSEDSLFNNLKLIKEKEPESLCYDSINKTLLIDRVSCIDILGNEKWRFDYSESEGDIDYNFIKNNLYLINNRETMYCLKNDGTIKWKMNIRNFYKYFLIENSIYFYSFDQICKLEI